MKILLLALLSIWFSFFCSKEPIMRVSDPLSLPEAVWTKPNIIRIPFKLTGALITIRAKVDTLEGNFIFDTGASDLLLNYRYFVKDAGQSGKSGGVTGSVQVKGRKTIDSLFIDNLSGRNIQADLLDLSHIERTKKMAVLGIIGYSVFKDYEILFDYEATVLTLTLLDKKGIPIEPIPTWEYVPIVQLPLVVTGHIALLNLRFGKKEKLFGLDSGAEQNMMDTRTNQRFLKANFTVTSRVKLRGAGDQSAEVLSGLLNNAQLDTFLLKPMATLLTNMDNINIVYNTNLEGILGYEFLSQRPMSINYKKRRLTIYKPVLSQP